MQERVRFGTVKKNVIKVRRGKTFRIMTCRPLGQPPAGRLGVVAVRVSARTGLVLASVTGAAQLTLCHWSQSKGCSSGGSQR
jgi:hypothetical protein